ncbi:sugar ABC transporter substrate-binding protein [Clostridium sp. AL.422]|uniref:sugar ABC transporter substrate-binding protein n=1 Tax=Clostridium TaxID=1485 RepID=UPI00293DE8FF|nr:MULTISPECIES: sugar ABC transporter substrate-binding protein [unclassified Clostridium]MDV4149326.1 sugar ABC transporter substrate-binding protein [Clostridium sp. AL.422]
MKKKIVALLSTVFLLAGLTGCGAGSNTEGKKVIYFIPIVDTGAYWSPMKKAAEDQAKALGYELVVKTTPPSEAQKNEKHIGFIDEAISKNVAGIAIAPMDPEMFDNKVKEANDAGIPVVTFDADVKTTGNRISYIGTDNKLAGEQLGENGAKELKEKGITSGKIGLVAVNLTQTTMTYRQDGIKAGFEKVMGADAKNFQWLEPIQDNDQSSVSKQQLEGQIVANQDMVAVFSLGSEGPDTGVMEAIKSQGKGGQIHHFGFDYTATWENGIESKLITGIVDQDSYAIGKTIIDVLDKKIKGENVEGNYPVQVKWIKAEEIFEYGVEKQKQFTEETK